MLKHIPSLLTPDLLWILAAMGHGDEIAVVDRNFPAHSVALATTSGERIMLPSVDAPRTIEAILTLMPLDTFVERPLRWMDPVDEPGATLAVHQAVLEVCGRAQGVPVQAEAVERHRFYDLARQSFAIVQNSESRPYGCFLLKKGVIFD